MLVCFIVHVHTDAAQLQPEFAEREPRLAADLRDLKLANCGVACLDLDLTAGPTGWVKVRDGLS